MSKSKLIKIGSDNYGCLYDDYFIFDTDNIDNIRNNKYDYITLARAICKHFCWTRMKNNLKRIDKTYV